MIDVPLFIIAIYFGYQNMDDKEDLIWAIDIAIISLLSLICSLLSLKSFTIYQD